MKYFCRYTNKLGYSCNISTNRFYLRNNRARPLCKRHNFQAHLKNYGILEIEITENEYITAQVVNA